MMLFPVLSVGLLLAGLLAFWTAARRLRAGRIGGLLVGTATGLSALLLGALALSVSLNLWSYHRLTLEEPLADVSVARTGDRVFSVRVLPVGGEPQSYRVEGEQWQIDARFIKWTPLFSLLGQSPLVRLERLSGRYARVDEERRMPRTVYSLERGRGIDIWGLARSGRVPGVDAYYGSAAYVPLADGALYHVTVTRSGLVVRPGNEQATASLASWE